jgi:hypothetical protein
MTRLIPTTAKKPPEECWIAMRESDEAGTMIFGVFLDEQQALACAVQQEAQEQSDNVRNLSSYGAQQSVLIYPRGVSVHG